MFRFIPNDYAKAMFNLKANEYVGEGLTPLLEGALGKANYDKYLYAQDPFCGGKSQDEVGIVLNRDSRHDNFQFRSIGLVQKFDWPSTVF